MSLHGGVASGCRVTQGRPLSIWCPSVDISDGGSLQLGWRHGQGCRLMAALEDAEIPALLSISRELVPLLRVLPEGAADGLRPGTYSLLYSLLQRYLLVSRGCVHMRMSPLQMYSKNWASTPAPVNKWSVSSTPVCCRAPVDVLLGCRALAAVMADANEKSKPILKQWIGMSLFMTGPRQILDLFLCASVCVLVCVCSSRGQKERHDSDEWMPKWQRYTFALNDAGNDRHCYCHSQQRKHLPRGWSWLHINVYMNWETSCLCAHSEKQMPQNLWHAFPLWFAIIKVPLFLLVSKDAACVSSILQRKQWVLVKSFICGSSNCLSRLKQFLCWQTVAG